MSLTGAELFELVFADELDDNEVELYDIQDLDGVTCYDEDLSYNSGWYNYYTVTFRYGGKKYEFEKREHTSDNVSDTDYYMDTFQESIEAEVSSIEEINKIIRYIEDELYDNWEEIVKDLENVKKVIINN